MIYEFLRKNIKIFVLNSSSYENEEKIWIYLGYPSVSDSNDRYIPHDTVLGRGVCLPVLSLYFDFALCFFFFISFFCGRLFYRRYLSVDFDLSFLCLAEKKRGEKNSRDDHTCPDVGIYLVLFCLGIELFPFPFLRAYRYS